MTLARRQTNWLFLGTAGLVYTAVFFVARSQTASVHPGVIGIAAMCDLVVTVPLLYYLLRVRPGYSSWLTIIAVFLVGARAVGFLLPAAERSHLPGIRWVGALLELWVVVAIAQRLRRTHYSTDPVGRIHEAARALFPSPWLAELVANEILVFYYALFAWRARSASVPGARAFPLAEASGYSLFTTFVLIALLFEGVPMHLLLHRWSHIAWLSTAAGVYALLWIVALRRSVELHPILIDDRAVVLQIGFLWRAEFPRDRIIACRPVTPGTAPGRKEPGYLRLAVLNEPQWLIELAEPAVVHGLFGRTKVVTSIGVAVDDPESFREVLNLT